MRVFAEQPKMEQICKVGEVIFVTDKHSTFIIILSVTRARQDLALVDTTSIYALNFPSSCK